MMTAMLDRRAQAIAAAEGMIPRLTERSEEAYRTGAIPADTLTELHDAGLFGLLLPAAYGGVEPDMIGAMEVAFQLARGCGSTAWVYGNNAMHDQIISLLPRAAQDEFWGDGNIHRIAATGWKSRWTKCEPVEGGYLLSGHWEFNSGIANCDAVLLTAPVFADGAMIDVRQFIVYRDQYRRLDDWDPFALRATGSTSGAIDEPLFVPDHRSVSAALQHRVAAPGEALLLQGAGVHDGIWNRLGLFTWVPLTVSPVLLGCAQGAIDHTIVRMQTRKTVMGESLRDSQAVQLRLAEAQIKVNMGRHLVFGGGLEEIAASAARGVAPDLVTRGKWRANAAFSARLAREVVDSLQYRGGATGIARTDTVARMFADVAAGSTHAATDWDNGGTIYGKALLGIDTSGIPAH